MLESIPDVTGQEALWTQTHARREYQIVFLDWGTAVNPGSHSGNMQIPHQAPEFFSCEGRTFLP